MNSGLLIPAHLKPARKHVRVVFYVSRQLNRIMVGFPEQYNCMPPGFEKVVCQTAAELDMWSERLRLQERMDQEQTDEQREMIEGPIRDACRKELLHKMATARNNINREFCRAAIARIDAMTRLAKIKTESYMHIEAHEDGH